MSESNGLVSARKLTNLLVNNKRFHVLVYVTKCGERKRRIFTTSRDLRKFRAKALSTNTQCYKLVIKSKINC